MGFFDSALTPASTLEPLTVERLRTALTQLEVNLEEEDGNLIAHFEQGYFFFMVLGDGQVLNVRGTWRGHLPAEGLAAASTLTENWNREMMIPKTYPATINEGDADLVLLLAECAFPTGRGLTDDQLIELVSTGISACLNFFEVATGQLGGDA
ncbi:MAG: YbjN domain-containing protein [Rothia sp. (in: high G+C Gram-positive bacteria)]|nr:YbjN domain-containing protein [Rothia sp. (in: high G+C Gram-positive bacteria)]